jgi:hypothetical protein
MPNRQTQPKPRRDRRNRRSQPVRRPALCKYLKCCTIAGPLKSLQNSCSYIMCEIPVYGRGGRRGRLKVGHTSRPSTSAEPARLPAAKAKPPPGAKPRPDAPTTAHPSTASNRFCRHRNSSEHRFATRIAVFTLQSFGLN